MDVTHAPRPDSIYYTGRLRGTERRSVRAHLKISTVEEGRTRQFPVGLPGAEGAAVVLGRSRRADVRLHDERISGRHLRIYVHQGRHWVEDLGSTNGTMLDGQPLSRPTPLDGGQILMAGQSVVQYVVEPASAAEGAALATIPPQRELTTEPDEADKPAGGNRSVLPSAAERDDDERHHEPPPQLRRGVPALLWIVLAIAAIVGLLSYLGWQVLRG